LDYRKFLGRREEIVLPYLGGRSVTGPGRSALVAGELAPGWWTFAIEGRTATALAPAQAPQDAMERLPAVRGHAWSGWLATADARAEPLELLPEDEPPRFSPCVARRWHSGELLFDRLEFEDEAEDRVRRAFEDGRALGDARSVPASLRAAFAYAVAADASRALGIPAAPLEILAAAGEIADGGRPAAERALRALAGEREAEALRRLREREAAAREGQPQVVRHAAPVAQSSPWARRLDVERDVERATEALRVARARLLDFRPLADERLELTWRVEGVRLVSIVDGGSLRVVSAGLCLSGEDSRLTLDSLPGVVREAIGAHRLVLMHGGGEYDDD
jgi:hypothetical protein